MTELNENSLQKAIQQLPHHKAGIFVWEEIRWQLDKPLSGELPLHPAPAGSWTGVEAALKVAGKTNFYRTSLIAGLVALLSFLILLPVLVPETSLPDKSAWTNSYNPMPAQTNGHSSYAKPTESTNEPVLETSSNHPFKPASPEENILPKEQPTQMAMTQAGESGRFTIHPVAQKKGQNIPGISFDPFETIRWRNDPRYAECASFHKVNTAVFMVADYEPVFFSNKAFNAPAHNFSVSSGYRHNRFGITLGAGYTRITGTSQVNYAYKTNELIYSYDYVDSVYVDPVTNITYYFTVKVDVYDSIDHNTSEEVFDRYSYLQLPLSVSYGLAASGRFSLDIQLTGTYYLLQDDYRNYKPFAEASSRLVSTTLEDKKVNSDFWSAGAGLVLSWQADSRLGISLTPRIRYNALPVKGSNDKGFISYGINFGVFFKITGDP